MIIRRTKITPEFQVTYQDDVVTAFLNLFEVWGWRFGKSRREGGRRGGEKEKEKRKKRGKGREIGREGEVERREGEEKERREKENEVLTLNAEKEYDVVGRVQVDDDGHLQKVNENQVFVFRRAVIR